MTVIVETKRLFLRQWRDDDRPVFRAMNADPQVMAHFPGTLSSRQSDELLDEIMAMPFGFGLCAVEVKATGEIAGACGIFPASVAGVAPDGAMEIGWRFIPSQWGQGFAREAGEGWIDHAFTRMELPELYAWTAETNKRSLAVMRRCGMERVPELDFKHPRVSDMYPQLKPHLVCKITREHWAAYK